MKNNDTFRNNMMTYIFAAVVVALALTAVVLIFRMVYEPPTIIVDVGQPAPEPSPTTEPQAWSNGPVEAELLAVDAPLAEPQQIEPINSMVTPINDLAIIEEPAGPLVPEEEIVALAKTLKGECYDSEFDDMRRVCWVVINRVEHEKFRDNIVDEVKAGKEHCPDGLGQFHGYRETNVPTEDNVAIATEVLSAWYSGDYSMRDELCEGKIYLYFASREGSTVNTFREG